MPQQFLTEKDLVSFVVSAKLPEWQRKLFKKYADAVQVHSQGELFFKLDRLFPNEQLDSKKHRILAFESVTEASFGRAANNVNRIFKNSSYSVEASDKVLGYTTAHNFDGVNFYSWFLDEWVKTALKTDANARIVAYPPEYYERNNRPPVVFIESEHIKWLTDDELIFLSVEESTIKYELQEINVRMQAVYDQSINMDVLREVTESTYTPKMTAVATRSVYHYFIKGVGFYKISQTTRIEGEDEGQAYELEFFPMKNDFLQWIDAGGEKGKNDVNKSFLNPFVAFGNLALLQHSQHTAVNFTFSFPRMSEIESPCDAEGCSMGLIQCETSSDLNTYGETKHCKACNGSGWKSNQTPYKIYKKRYDPQGMDGDNDHLSVPDVQFYTPPTAILEYSKEEWKGYLEMAEIAVYISQRVATGNTESAKSKEIDRDDMYSFLSRVGQSYYNRLRFVLQCMENYMIGKPTQVSVQVPVSYAIITESEAFEALKEILTSNVPVMIKASQVEGFIAKFISQASPIRKFLDVLKLVDPLLYYNSTEISSYKANQVVSLEQFSNHVFAYHALQNMYFEDPTIFLYQETYQIAEKLKVILKTYVLPPVTDLKTKYTGQPQ